MLERLLFATSPAVENIDSTLVQRPQTPNTASRIFFGGQKFGGEYG